MRETDLGKKAQIKRKLRWKRLMMVILTPLFMTAFCVTSIYFLRQQPADNTEQNLIFAEFEDAGIIKNQINILILGVDGNNLKNSKDAAVDFDAVIVAGINSDDGTVKLLSIPCDTRINIPGWGIYDKINFAYAYGGGSLARDTVVKFLKVPIHHYVTLDFWTFAEMVDILGGIDLYVEDNIKYEDFCGGEDIDLKKGYQRLNGKKAREYVKFCGDEMGDIGRIQRQQRLLKVLLQEGICLNTIFKLPTLTSLLNRESDTDISFFPMLKTANILRSLKPDAVKTEIIPGQPVIIDGVVYWEPDREKTEQMIFEMFYNVSTEK